MEKMAALVDAVLLPGMVTLTIGRGLDRVDSLNKEMRESAALWAIVDSRLHYLQAALPHVSQYVDPDEYPKLVARFGEVIGLAIDWLKKYSSKKGLQRVAASRAVREAARLIHDKIDAVFIGAGLGNAPEMTAWRAQEPAAVNEQHARLKELIASRAAFVSGLSVTQLQEAVTEIQLELTRRPNPREFRELLEHALTVAADIPDAVTSDVAVIPDWFVSRDEVEIGKEIDIGAFGAVHIARWGVARTEVCAKLLFVEGSDAQRQLLGETRVWSQLSHPNIVRMLGACHVGTPLFFISELAKNGNLVDFLQRDPANKLEVWRLFLDAAQGLSYLHGQSIVHADLKCNNILVGNDGKALLCDFGFSHTRTLSIGKSVKVQTEAVRWKAPECLLEVGAAANPSFASDVYSLGMSIIEAMIGGVPWGVVSDDDIIDEVASGEGYPRPANVFNDNEWKLVQRMTAFEVADRMSLSQVIEQLRELGREGTPTHDEVMTDVGAEGLECEWCGNPYAPKSKFCSECGGKLPGN